MPEIMPQQGIQIMTEDTYLGTEPVWGWCSQVRAQSGPKSNQDRPGQEKIKIKRCSCRPYYNKTYFKPVFDFKTQIF